MLDGSPTPLTVSSWQTSQDGLEVHFFLIIKCCLHKQLYFKHFFVFQQNAKEMVNMDDFFLKRLHFVYMKHRQNKYNSIESRRIVPLLLFFVE